MVGNTRDVAKPSLPVAPNAAAHKLFSQHPYLGGIIRGHICPADLVEQHHSAPDAGDGREISFSGAGKNRTGSPGPSIFESYLVAGLRGMAALSVPDGGVGRLHIVPLVVVP